MSVTLEKYCETSQSKFAKALKVAMEKGIFIPQDEITFYLFGTKVRAHVSGSHALSCYDFEKLQKELSGYYWQIWPSSYQYKFNAVFFLKTDEQ